ncbi:uncharacterized protein LOC110812819 isoform X3 [Carica papaya]|uniref:uncharacterized protein LOC110812819 isoform X3 n=1 Tax=Carica papaya TaxID=3649 RepID=UPI000B8C7382|nr:uncharacterized protein LOC110812819 isoform X3 [Carica papaya]
MKLFDVHCHLQDPQIIDKAPKLISTAVDSGVVHFAVNGLSEKDWHLVKEMGERYPSVVPCFGLHPWYVAERSSQWFDTLKEFFENTPSAAVGEVEVFQQQLELAKTLKRPASVHCVRAYGDLLEIMKSKGPFLHGILLHSYLGSAEMVPEFAKLGAYFSFSGFLMSLKGQKAKKILKAVPSERILLETDAPDALPKLEISSLYFVDGDPSLAKEIYAQGENATCGLGTVSDGSRNALTLSKETLNHPANIHNVLTYVASLLDMSKEELAELSYRNAVRLFSFEGSELVSHSPNRRWMYEKEQVTKHATVLKNIAKTVASFSITKPSSSSQVFVNEDIISNILVRLPAEILLTNMRCVCQRWYNVIQNPVFIVEHLRLLRTGLLIQSINHPFSSHFVEIRESSIKSCIDFDFPGKIMAGHDGLLVFKDAKDNKSLHVANPVTKQQEKLPLLTFPYDVTSLKCGLARVASTGEYKAVITYKVGKFKQRFQQMVTLGSDKSWRWIDTSHVDSTAQRTFDFAPFCIGGFIYWCFCKNPYVVVLDVATEKVHQVPVPECCVSITSTYLSMGNSLSMILRDAVEMQLEVWILTDMKEGEWVDLYRINLEPERHMISDMFGMENIVLSPFAWMNNGELLILRVESNFWPFISCNVKTGEIRFVELYCDVAQQTRRVHVNSLVSWRVQ